MLGDIALDEAFLVHGDVAPQETHVPAQDRRAGTGRLPRWLVARRSPSPPFQDRRAGTGRLARVGVARRSPSPPAEDRRAGSGRLARSPVARRSPSPPAQDRRAGSGRLARVGVARRSSAGPGHHRCAQADASKATTTPQLYGRRASCPGPDVGPVRGALFGPDPGTSVVHQVISSSTSLAGDGPPVAVQQPPHPLRAQPGPPGPAEQPHVTDPETPRTKGQTSPDRRDLLSRRLPTPTRPIPGTPPRHALVALPHHQRQRHGVAVPEQPSRPAHRRTTLTLRDGRRLNASGWVHNPP